MYRDARNISSILFLAIFCSQRISWGMGHKYYRRRVSTVIHSLLFIGFFPCNVLIIWWLCGILARINVHIIIVTPSDPNFSVFPVFFTVFFCSSPLISANPFFLSFQNFVTAYLYRHIKIVEYFLKHYTVKVVIFITEGGTYSLKDELCGSV